MYLPQILHCNIVPVLCDGRCIVQKDFTNLSVNSSAFCLVTLLKKKEINLSRQVIIGEEIKCQVRVYDHLKIFLSFSVLSTQASSANVLKCLQQNTNVKV